MFWPKRHHNPLKPRLIAQQDDYSCGPACLATVANLCQSGNLYDFFCRQLAPKPCIGSHPLAMTDIARRHLPLLNAGEKTYDNGLAVAYILYQDIVDPTAPLVDHYVVLLGRQQDTIFYFDPWDTKVFCRPEEKILWHSTYAWPALPPRIEKWSLNFQGPEWLTPDLCRSVAVPHPH